MRVYERDEILKLIGRVPWISPFKRLIALADERKGLIELVEEHARGICIGGAAWAKLHYGLREGLVLKSRREGSRVFYLLREGCYEATLKPSYAPAAITEAYIRSDFVELCFTGLAGAGIALLGRAAAEGVYSAEVIEEHGVWKARFIIPKRVKLMVGVDDTDVKDEGATWSLVNECGYMIENSLKAYYVDNVIVQLYPENPFKTQNCASSAIALAVMPSHVDEVRESILRFLRDNTKSTRTGLAFYVGLKVPKLVQNFLSKARKELVDVELAKEVAMKSGVKLHSFQEERGIIGALAGLAGLGRPDAVARV
ncbi:MAG: hypothetical protein DRJ33_03900 [Candidatus Methanomethylicota archaeon]|mgnify:CR=1 FL=1|uniref:TiaS-like TCKD domain-containing protein n=1 Tax=Thermoproteota archaeon TaxID=2056631 RepID=A0A497F0J6_9CREN|nr:MAG: hypothetical protein DRJ33_03900 [Candidatus Verstraetearchaeota archaeon]